MQWHEGFFMTFSELKYLIKTKKTLLLQGLLEYGVEDGIRTRDPWYHKPML